ncbi:hypothetical protein F4809DRAFT_613363 [Biscogniauxia mediterranea]|nr:hypothetical protein F4809DRAFT_613363 [Biscogniauxia mediterranea]
MMATEATAQNPVDVSALDPSHTEPAVANPGSQHVGPSRTTLNGSPDEIENKQIADIVDDLVNSAEASVSGGSDTEAFKGDPSKLLGDKGHVRNSSSAVKKPLSFKSVSVNRTFLASKSTSNSNSRPESTAGSASAAPQPTVASSASRLKLVAKSGSNLGGSTKTLSTNGKPASAPDPSLVWNRNRAPPPPEPKKISDEELVKEYGIHMAHRLGPEDTKGESNWADIEDDDEWEPETITWTDGTKVTLPHSEEPPPAVQAPAPSPPARPTINKDPVIAPKPKSPALAASASGSPSVKPGVLASGKGLVLKGAPEKPTLVAKPPAPPTPVKSPWAQLPPVEKVSPVVMDLPHHAQPSRYPLRDASNTKGATPPPAKEIAADDFSRTGWRDNHHANPNKELFNSQSGRYEPVSDRRGSRHDIHGRQPALLQRPYHPEQQGPAEPSAAFQTSRTSGQEVPYGRRRGSSNVSGGSGNFAPRLGIKTFEMGPPPDVIQPLGRPSSITSGAESPVSHRTFSPANNQPANRGHPSQTYQPRPSPVPSHATPYQHQPNPDTVAVEQFENQKKYMTARREEAIRRRLEQEAREEEAKRARIAEKLKALGPAPERKSTKKETPKDETTTPSINAMYKSPSQTENSAEPTASVAAGSEVSTSEKPASQLVSAASDNTTADHSRSDARINGSHKDTFNQPERIHGPPGQSPATMHPHQSARPWVGASQHQERLHTWSRGTQNTSNNVWAPPGSSSGLGNGVFNSDIGSLPDSNPNPFNQKSHPGPIAPPRTNPQDQPLPSELAPKRLDPIAPPQGRSKQYPSQKRATSPDPRAGAWKSFASGVKADDAERRDERLRRQNQLDDSAFNPRTQDTWRPVELNKDGKRTSLGTHADAPSNAPASWNNHAMNGPARDRLDGTTGELSGPDGMRSRFSRQAPVGPSRTAAPGPPAQARGESRFFPTSKETQQADLSKPQDIRTKSPTPPPPTADGHPVYDGDATRPHVALPPQKIRVKLPPSSQPAASPGTQASKPAPISFAAAAATPIPQRGPGRPSSRGVGFGGVAQTSNEIKSQENWQDRINVLMGKKSASPAKSMPVDSSSKVAIEHTHTYDPPVSLPPLSPSYTSSTDSSITSKEMAEECFGEQEMGSLPNVRLPNEAPDAAWQAVTPNWNPAPVRLRIDPVCAEPISFHPEYSNGKTLIRISTPGMTDVKTVTASLMGTRSQSNPRRTGPRGGSRRTSRGGQRGGRDGSEHPMDLGSSSPSGRAMSNRGGRSHSYRPRTENWGRHTSSTSAAQS